MRIAVLALLAIGCATESKSTRTEEPGVAAAANGPTVTAEQNEAIDALFRRKAPQLQSCWQDEFQRSGNRKVEGDITLSMIVTKAGKATELKNVKSTIGVPALDACVLKEVGTWVFPEGPGDAPYRRTVHLGPAF